MSVDEIERVTAGLLRRDIMLLGMFTKALW